MLSVALIPSVVAAQRMGDMTFGIMGGPQFATLKEDPDPTEVEYGYKAGVLAGVFLAIPLTDVFSIEPQALFSQKGADVDGTGAKSSLDGSIRINYIEIPVLLKVRFPMSYSQVTPFLFAGPSFAFRVGCTARGEILTATGSEDCDKVGNGTLLDLKSTDVGLTGGGGIQFNAGGYPLRLDARYTWGLTDINDSGDAREIKNRAFAATIGIGFPFPR
jgi:hypothetical protein